MPRVIVQCCRGRRRRHELHLLRAGQGVCTHACRVQPSCRGDLLTGVEQCPWKTLPTCASGQYPILDKVGQQPTTCGVEGAIVPSGGDAADEMRYM